MNTLRLIAGSGLILFAAVSCDAPADISQPPAAQEPRFDHSTSNEGDPCDPATYTGPGQCVPDPDGDGYIIAN